jgi:hypothetical protein
MSPLTCQLTGTLLTIHTSRQGGLRRTRTALKEVVAEQALELRLLKKSMIADGEDGQ